MQGASKASGWKKRFFKQEGSNLAYFKTDFGGTPALGFIDIAKEVTDVKFIGKGKFDIVTSNRTYHIEARGK